MKKDILKFPIRVLLCNFIFLSFSISLIAQEYTLVWSDEFDEDGKPNPAYWSFENGFVRNQELQWYQDDNAYCKDGVLIIEGRREKKPNPLYVKGSNTDWRRSRPFIEYTSSSLKTAGKKEFLYGRFEIRARIPLESGSWPAIWTLGTTMEWPSCGEIDIMEYYRINNEPHLFANVAWGTDERYKAEWRTRAVPFRHFLEKNSNWGKEFHVWRLDWEENSIKLYLDDELLNEVSLNETVNGVWGNYTHPFKQPHYLLLNLALGANGGEPDVSAFPMKYEIDYVRVYQKKEQVVRPGRLWLDDRGEHINAHGGGVLYHEGSYYWFGEHKSENSNAALVGINCYSSDDLVNWKYEGVALPVSDDPKSEITKGCVMERPKVIYNEKTGKFVMWFHLELKGQGYKAARSALAVSDNVTGPYAFVRSERINKGFYPFDMPEDIRKLQFDPEKYSTWWTPEWYKAVENGLFLKRDFEEGQMARDMTLFVDDDGKAYHIYASEENLTLHIAELTDDYTGHTGKYIRVAPGGHNEAPTIFKRKGTYWMITSGCTGWEPNAARLFSAPSIWGPWKQHSNPCRGEKSEITFGGQGTFVQQVYGKKDAYVFMGDMWRPKFPIDGRYMWLPVKFEKDIPYLEWMDEWDLDFL
jgi:beta-glucanase (GH16 family)